MALSVGDIAPSFTAKNTAGETVSLSDFAGKVVVLYFYPKDDTPGCTKQAQSFRDRFEEFQNREIVVLGVSFDDETSHKAFTEKYGLPFSLLADTKGEIAQAYGVAGEGYAKRVTFVIGPDGKLIHIDASVNTAQHADDILKAVG